MSPGSYLLSRDLSSDYHRRADVSLPGSEWGRVGPSGCDHQAAKGMGGGGGWVPLVSLFRLSGVRAAVLCVGGAWGLFWGGQVGIRVAGGGKWGGFRFVSESCF